MRNGIRLSLIGMALLFAVVSPLLSETRQESEATPAIQSVADTLVKANESIEFDTTIVELHEESINVLERDTLKASSSLTDVLPKILMGEGSGFRLNVDSLIRSEINNFGLALLCPRTHPLAGLSWESRDENNFLSTMDSLSIAQVLIWDIQTFEGHPTFSLFLMDLPALSARGEQIIMLTGTPSIDDQLMRKAVWEVLDKTPTPGLFEDKVKKDWAKRFKAEPKRYIIAGLSTAILAWVLIHDSPEDQSSHGIGSPPDWPQN